MAASTITRMSASTAKASRWDMCGDSRPGAEFALSHQWISVDEVLPEYEEDVLALIGGAPVIAKGYHVRAGLRYNTHWMPIPKFEQQSKM